MNCMHGAVQGGTGVCKTFRYFPENVVTDSWVWTQRTHKSYRRDTCTDVSSQGFPNSQEMCWPHVCQHEQTRKMWYKHTIEFYLAVKVMTSWHFQENGKSVSYTKYLKLKKKKENCCFSHLHILDFNFYIFVSMGMCGKPWQRKTRS